MMSSAMLISIILSTAALSVGLMTAAIWIRIANRVSDPMVKAKFMYCALVLLLLASSQVLYVLRKTMGLTAGTFEYLQYTFIIFGFLAFLASARQQMMIAEKYGIFTQHKPIGPDAKKPGKAGKKGTAR